jgi:outer membrane cobalamin receptor
MPLWWVLLALAASDAAPAKLTQSIVVIAAREEQPRDQAAAAVTVLERKDIEQLPATSLSEVLGFVPGVTMMFDSGASGIPMITSRGFFGGGEVEYVKVLVDGVPAGDVESGNVDWQRFRAAGIERIEMLHGPGSALYGDAALGGVIQIVTRDETAAEVDAGAGSFGGRDLRASGGYELAHGMHLSVDAGLWQTAGYRAHANTNDRLLDLSLHRLGDASRWRIGARGDHEERHQPGALTEAEIAADRQQSNALFRFDRETTTRRRIDATYDSYGAVPLRAAIYATSRDDQNLRTLLLAPGFGSSAFRSLATHATGGTAEASHEWTSVTVRGGSDVERATLDGAYDAVTATGDVGTRTGEEHGGRTRAAAFVTGGWAASERLRFSAGVRRDEVRDDVAANRRTSTAWSPRAGVNVHLTAGPSPLSFFAQLSRAFKAPTLDQRFDPRAYPDGRGGTFTISNADLLPQRAHNAEAGLSRASSWSEWSVVAYRLNVTDEIDFDPQTFTYRNIGSSLHRGAEASVTLAKSSRVSAQLGYAWTHVADATAPSQQLKNIPEHAAQLLLHARITAATTAGAIVRWRGALALDDGGIFATPAVTRVDFRIAHDFGALRLNGDLLNAGNARYNELGYVLRDFRGRAVPFQYPAPGRSIRFGFTWTSQRRNG